MLGQLKNVAVVLSSVFLFASVVSATQAVGYLISIIGFFLYNKAKSGPTTPPVAGKDTEARSEPQAVVASEGEVIVDVGTPASRAGSVFSRQSTHVRNVSIPEVPLETSSTPTR